MVTTCSIPDHSLVWDLLAPRNFLLWSLRLSIGLVLLLCLSYCLPPQCFWVLAMGLPFFLILLLSLGVSRSWVCSFSLVSLWALALGGHNQALFLPLSSERNPKRWQSLSDCGMLDVHQPLNAISTLCSHLNILPCVQNNFFIKPAAAEGRKFLSGLAGAKISICFLYCGGIKDSAIFQVMQKPKQTSLSLL